MYRLPSDANLDFFKGKTLIQACFGANDLILNFSENISVAVFSSIGVGLEAVNLKRFTAFEEASANILALLNKDVTDIHWTVDGTITLLFDNGHAIEVYDDSTDFESYTISSPAGQVIV